ncbi:hypothetical protein DVH24_019939 [Malus domestica]|uniref:Reverse transcriptase Ty1/copia-type domain-containing protein n=1 Tax=Malus domestica TaxID=3750 RepID=A0A498I6B9_MALDO|nr:hypothetical protein DVH24_019939 [Malus domestica]
MQSLFKDLQLNLTQPRIWCDNISSISLASNPVFTHVDYHYVREKVVRGELLVNFICSQDQIADLFTKGLSFAHFKLLVSKLLVIPRSISLRRDVRLSPDSHPKQTLNTLTSRTFHNLSQVHQLEIHHQSIVVIHFPVLVVAGASLQHPKSSWPSKFNSNS